ncbi:MAG: purine-nucleoside/S-methyl-5-thioadenosine phosphorylase / adenosine deaminase [Campylobacterota bacterium]|nr:purine-nucleoside/S-methyl-5-thioadenosine phosphorylase / adenosine deaminase [Campylobacterota bacterium]
MNLLPCENINEYPYVTAHFTTREGGVSQSPYGTLNLAFHVGDTEEDVVENHRLLGEKLNYNPRRLIHMRQIHSDIVTVVSSTMNFESPPQCDALITNRVNVPLMVMSADCTPVLIYDPKNHAIGAVHAGRAGALKSIVPKTLHAMEKHFGTSPEEVLITLGPSIHGCCYEINETIADDVKEKGYENALLHQKEKVYLDVNTILYLQLRAMRVSSRCIESASHCTSCHNGDYFSYRADHQRTGRIAGVIVLRSLPA